MNDHPTLTAEQAQAVQLPDAETDTGTGDDDR